MINKINPSLQLFVEKFMQDLTSQPSFNKSFEAIKILDQQQIIFENKLKLIKELKSAYLSLYR